MARRVRQDSASKTDGQARSLPSAGASTRVRSLPPGRIKIAQALRQLLEQKEFNAITTAEIARTAGVAEALIYRYFGDKRGLLHQVLKEYLEEYFWRFEQDLKGIQGALNKLRKQIWGHINVYATNRVFARILLLEVRSYPDYYRSETYELVKKYSNLLLEIIEEGIREGEIRGDISPRFLRQVILGGIEHLCLTGVIFQREILQDDLTEDFCNVLFDGLRSQRQAIRPRSARRGPGAAAGSTRKRA